MLKPTQDKEARLTDDEFSEWCGSHTVKRCGRTRKVQIGEGETRTISICEDCRVRATLEKLERLGYHKDESITDEELREQISCGVIGAGDTNMTPGEAVNYIVDAIKEAGYHKD